MHQKLLAFKAFETDPMYIAWIIGALFFFSMALSYGQSEEGGGKPRSAGATFGLGLLFVVIGDAIIYGLWQLRGWPHNYQFNNVAIYSYGFMLMIAFVAATMYLSKRGKLPQWKIPSEVVLDLMTFIIIGSIVGARLLYVALEWNTQYSPAASGKTYANNAEAVWAAFLGVLRIWEGGLSFHGGILGAMLFAFFYTAYKRYHYWRMADFVAPAVALGGIFGRIGCFLNGCCYGLPVKDVPGIVMPVLNDNIPRHPAQLYEAFGHLLLFGYLTNSERSIKFPGHLFLRFIVGYSWVRFFVDFFRSGDSAATVKVGGSDLVVTVAQLASLLVVVLGSFLIFYFGRRADAALAEEEQKGEMIAPGKLVVRESATRVKSDKPAETPKAPKPVEVKKPVETPKVEAPAAVATAPEAVETEAPKDAEPEPAEAAEGSAES